jgi:hypothetical protein
MACLCSFFYSVADLDMKRFGSRWDQPEPATLFILFSVASKNKLVGKYIYSQLQVIGQSNFFLEAILNRMKNVARGKELPRT